MEVKVLKENLAEALTELNKTAPKRATLPITANVLFATKDGRLTATATDLELAVTAYIGAQVVTEGSSTVPVVKLSRMLARIKADEALIIKAEGTKTTFSMDGRTFSLDGAKAEDFPPTPSRFDKRSEVDGAELKDRLKRVVISARTDTDRPVLHAVNMQAKDGTLTLAATDGFQLATFTMPYKGADFEANVPLSVVAALIRLLPKDDVVGVDVGEHTIRFTFKHYDVTSTLIQGTFPNYRRVIPEDFEHAVMVDRDALLSEAETAMVLASDGSGIIRLLVLDGALRIVAKSEEVGDYEADIPAQVEGVEGSKVGLSGRFMLNILARMQAGTVRLQWQRGDSPVRIEQGDDGLYVIMPTIVAW
jgi:DNA polymerase-3 subunit beta